VTTLTGASRTRVLPVPYFMQPTDNTCQSTVLKMMASYLGQSVMRQSTGAAERDILDIWKDVNESPQRPSKMRNAHSNMKWWLEQHFPSLRFEYLAITDEVEALEKIIGFIDASMPVLVSVSHARVAGHIILVVGYENYMPMASTPDFDLVVHDPYGRFDPSLLSKSYGRMRWLGGSSLVGGGETGPGQSCRLSLAAVGRQRKGDSRRGTYYLLSARR
jgi:Peptidase_C39 like family